MRPTVRGASGSRALWPMLLSVALISSLFVPAVALAAGPRVTINLAAGQSLFSGTSPINYTVVFADPVEGFTGGDVSIGGTAGGTKAATVTGGPKIYNVAVTGMTTDGLVRATVPAGVAFNPAAEPNLASTSTSNEVAWAPGGPSVTVNQAAGQDDPTTSSLIKFTVVFSAPVKVFGEVVVSGTAGGTKSTTITGSGTTYSVSVAGMTTPGSVIVTVPDGAALGSLSFPFRASHASTSTDNTVTYAAGGPTVTINQAAGQADPTGMSPINFTVEFTQPVQGFTSGEVIIGGTAGGTKTVTVTGGPKIYNVGVSGMTNGSLTATLPADVAYDPGGDYNLASSSTDNEVYFLPGGPSVTVNQAAGQADPSGTSPIYFLVAFSAPVNGFATGDVTITGTAGGTKTAIVTGSGTAYEVAVTGMTTPGTVIATVADGVAADAGARPSLASTSTDNTVTWAPAAPATATITLTTSAPTPPGAKDPVILWGQGFTLGIQFDANGANRTVQLQGSRDAVAWTTITTLTTDAAGRASFFYRPATNQSYRAVFAGAPDLAGATSNLVRTVVRQLAVMRPTNVGAVKPVSRNTSITFTTTVRPARPELAPATVTFNFYRQVSGGWQLVTTRVVVIDGGGLARTTFQFTSPGQWYVRSQAGPTQDNANSVLTPIERYSVR